MTKDAAQSTFVGIALLLAGIYLLAGASISLGAGNNGDIPRYVWAIMGSYPGAMILAGLWMDKRAPVVGSILVLVGAVPLAVLFWWTMFLPVLAVVLVACSAAKFISHAGVREVGA